MKKFIKITTITVVSIILLLIILGYTVSRFINTDTMKSEISNKVFLSTGRQLNINGNLHWSFFPWLGVSISDATLSNPAGFPNTPFIEIKQATIRVRVLPLFAGRAELSSLALDKPVIHMIKNANGNNNWQLFTASTATADSTAQEDQADSARHFKVNISAITINDAAITYRNDQSHQNIALDKVNMDMQNIALNKSFPFNAEFNLVSQAPRFSGPVKASSKVFLNPTSQTYQLHHFQLTANLVDPKNSNRQLNAKINTDLDINLQQQTIAVNSLKLTINNVTINGNVMGQQIRVAPNFIGKFTIEPFNPRALVNSLGTAPPNTKNPFVLTKAQGSLQFTASANAININPLQFTVDDSHLTGNASISNLNQQPQIKFALNLDKLDLDHYIANNNAPIPAKKPQTNNGGFIKQAFAARNNKSQTSAAPAVQATIPANNNYTINGILQINQARVNNLRLQNISVSVNSAQNTLILAPITADFYQGKLNANARINNFTATAPSYALSATLANVQIQPLLQDVTGSNILTGALNMKLDTTTQGNNKIAILQNLNGHGQLAFANGNISGFNLAYQLAIIDSLVHKTIKPSQAGPNNTVINSLTGTFDIKNGNILNNDLSLKSPLMDVKGQGNINVVQQRWQYHLRATVYAGSDARLINLEQMMGGSIPFIVQGSFDNFNVTPDMIEIGKGVLTTQAKQLGKQVDQVVKQNFGKTLNNLQQNFGVQIIPGSQ